MGRRGIVGPAVCTLVLVLGTWLPARAGAPEAVEPMRKRVLSGEQYHRLRDEWKAYAEAHPTDARAWAQLARAAWYCNDPPAVSLEYAEKAYRLGPDDPDACSELAKHRWVVWSPGQPTQPDEAIRLCEHALAVAPETDDAHVRLWVLRLAKGDRAGAEAELRSLLDRGRIPEPLVDFAYNELIALAPNAVLFTNGDNDTYPAVALQAGRGLRRDVTIVNLSMLNLGWYRRMLREGPNPVPVPLLDQDPAGVSGGPEALRAVIAQVQGSGSKRPVYLAVTVPRNAYEVKARLSVEGVVFRVLPGKGDEMEADTARIEHNISSLYRLQSATSPALDWDEWSSVRTMVSNYAAMDMQLGMARARAGNKVGAGRAFDRALKLCAFHHLPTVTTVLTVWRNCDPGSRDLARWTRQLGK